MLTYLHNNHESLKKTENPINKSGIELKDNRPKSILQQKKVGQSVDKNEVIQQKQNNTGLPDNLKSGIENLSGHSMDDVKVHYNSSQPAQLNAHAFAQGNQIHIAPGQEKHLPHEAWHVVQQKQGRVKSTKQLKGKVNINDDAGLEKEADVMGSKALQMKKNQTFNSSGLVITNGSYSNVSNINLPLQRKVGFEFQTVGSKTGFYKEDQRYNEGKVEYFEGTDFTIEGDESDLELVTVPFSETKAGLDALHSAITKMWIFATFIKGKDHTLSDIAHFKGLQPKSAATRIENRNVVLKGDSEILADPQTTVGIKIDSLLNLATVLAQAKTRKSAFKVDQSDGNAIKPTGEIERNVSMKYMQYDAQQLADFIGWKDFESKLFQDKIMKNSVKIASEIHVAGMSGGMKGFLFLLVQYLISSRAYQTLKSQVPYWAKLAIPIMSRTHLGDLFLALPVKDKHWLLVNRHEIAGFLGAKVGGNETTPAFPLMEGEKVDKTFSIYDWILWLTDTAYFPGIDLSSVYEGLGDISSRQSHQQPLTQQHLYKGNVSTVAQDDKDTARNRYARHMASPTDIDDPQGAPGAVIELRKLGAKLGPEEWWPFASAVFELMVLLNKGSEQRNEIMGVNDL